MLSLFYLCSSFRLESRSYDHITSGYGLTYHITSGFGLTYHITSGFGLTFYTLVIMGIHKGLGSVGVDGYASI